MDIRYYWEEGYIPAALAAAIVLLMVALYFVFRAQRWDMVWYWVGVGGFVLMTAAGIAKFLLEQ